MLSSIKLRWDSAVLTLGSRKTGEWRPVEGTEYYAINANLTGDAWLQEAVSDPSNRPSTSNSSNPVSIQNFASFNRIATGIYGNDSKITFEVQGAGKDQWVSFYHQSSYNPFPVIF